MHFPKQRPSEPVPPKAPPKANGPRNLLSRLSGIWFHDFFCILIAAVYDSMRMPLLSLDRRGCNSSHIIAMLCVTIQVPGALKFIEN